MSDQHISPTPDEVGRPGQQNQHLQTEPAPREQSGAEPPWNSSTSGCRAAVLGAALVHPLLFLLAFAWGAIFGARGGSMASADPGPVQYGWEGGECAFASLFWGYISSCGMLPLIVSNIGAAVAVGARQYLRGKRHDS